MRFNAYADGSAGGATSVARGPAESCALVRDNGYSGASAGTATARAEDGEVLRPGVGRPASLAGELSEVLSGDEVVVGKAGGAAEGAGFDQVDDSVDVVVEAAVAVDDR